GISSTKSNLIITTDADCIVPPNWLQTCVDAFENKELKLLLAPVIYKKKRGFFQNFYCLEFFSLIASGAGAASINLPFMGNGANMAFTRQAYEAGITSKAYNRYTSGDDVFLIHQTVKKFGRKSVRFLLHHQMLVETPPPVSVKQFLNQRLRWASKAKGYQSPEAILVSLVVLLANSMLGVLFLTGFWLHWLWPVFGLLILTKSLIDMPLVFGYADFAHRSDLKKWFIPFSFLYPFYIVMVGFTSLVFSFNWKGRHYSR
ncbi:MAG: glycosyltransferase family 2 protein, partial [Bacteroidales bacterium]